jgi:signal transduction histidine kinase
MVFEAHQFITRIEFDKRIRWLINLRWIAAAGLFLVIMAARSLLEIDLPALTLYCGNAALAVYNGLFLLYFRRLESCTETEIWFRKANIFVNLQISLDLLLLLYLIHFTGGQENPFMTFFVFHMVIASILLSRRAAYLQASVIIMLYGIVFGGEAAGILEHVHLAAAIPVEQCFITLSFFSVSFFGFALTLYITVYLSTTIIQKLRERESDLEVANIKLREQDRVKSQYVFTVSHDIRGAIGAIQSCLKVVLYGITGRLSKKSREMVARAEHRSRVLLHFVQNLLELSEIRAAEEISRKPIMISKIVDRALSDCSLRIEEKNLRFSLKNTCAECVAVVNQELMVKLVAEILNNSAMYTPEGGSIEMQIVEQKGTPSVSITVSDNGIGIPEDQQSRIYDDFFRASNAKEHDTDGTGLGLSLAKQIVGVHGGAITVESKENMGSSFTVTLPIQYNQEGRIDE